MRVAPLGPVVSERWSKEFMSLTGILPPTLFDLQVTRASSQARKPSNHRGITHD
jgi:hypothetical protein